MQTVRNWHLSDAQLEHNAEAKGLGVVVHYEREVIREFGTLPMTITYRFSLEIAVIVFWMWVIGFRFEKLTLE